MRRVFFLMMCLLAWIVGVDAQDSLRMDTVKVDGKILEPDSISPADYATVQLLTLPDSSFAMGAVCGADGTFTLRCRQGQYLMKISSVGFKPSVMRVVVNGVKEMHLGTITLGTSQTMLQNVQIVAQIPPMVQQGDTTTYNAGAFAVAEGSALEDLLKKLPGAEIDENGVLIINGEKVTKVLMDGQEFFISDLNSAMRDIPADMIQRLKVYHRKSEKARATGIDDGNNDFVLDLQVKPDRKKGWNGQLMAGRGNDGQYQGRVQANRFKDKMNISFNGSIDDNGISQNKRVGANYSQRSDKLNYGTEISFNRNDNNRWSNSDTETFLTDTTSQYSHNESQNVSFRNQLSASLRLEWRPDTLTTLSFRPRINYSNGESTGNSSSWTQNNAREFINRKQSDNPETSHSWSTGGSLFVNRRLGKPGRNVSLNVDYNFSNSHRNLHNQSATYYMLYGDSVQLRKQFILTDDDNKEVSLRLSYTEPLFKNHYLEASYSYRYRPSIYEKYAYEWVDSLNAYSQFPDSAQSRCTESYYHIQRGNLAFVANTEKVNYTFGLEMEAQTYDTRNYFEDITVTSQSRTVVNYMPTFNMSYRFAKTTTLRLNYRGSSSQPSLSDLQTITDNSDPLNIRTGNPNLRPAFNNNVSVNFNQTFTSRRSNISAYGNWRNQMNRVAWVVTYDETTGARKNYPRNVNGNWGMDMGFNFYTPLGDVQKSKLNVSTSSKYKYNRSVGFMRISGNENSVENVTNGTTLYQQLKANFRSGKYSAGMSGSINYFMSRNTLRRESDRSTYDYSFQANTELELPWDLRFSTNIDCQVRRGYGKNDKTRTMWNAQLSKSFLKRKTLILRINLYDILREQDFVGHSVSESSIRDWSSSTTTKYFMASLTYRFNKFSMTRIKRSGR